MSATSPSICTEIGFKSCHETARFAADDRLHTPAGPPYGAGAVLPGYQKRASRVSGQDFAYTSKVLRAIDSTHASLQRLI